MFEFKSTGISGCFEMQPTVRGDDRGRFVKTVHADWFKGHDLNANFVEQYYSVSKGGVLRGLHFQTPPHAHEKLVYCTAGEVFDVVVDLRKGSQTFGEHRSVMLSAERGNQLYIPAGLAHGFYVTSTEATLVYNVTSVYAPEHDMGIRWNSVGIDWPDQNPNLSPRDANLDKFSEFESPWG